MRFGFLMAAILSALLMASCIKIEVNMPEEQNEATQKKATEKKDGDKASEYNYVIGSEIFAKKDSDTNDSAAVEATSDEENEDTIVKEEEKKVADETSKDTDTKNEDVAVATDEVKNDVKNDAPDTTNEKADEVEDSQNADDKAADAADNLILKMSDEKRMNVNLFLSNLSETFYDPDTDYYGENENLIRFAYLHAKLNWSKILVNDGDDEGLSAANVDTILERFFGHTVPHETPKNSRRWTYRNGHFFAPAADGAPYPDFTVVTSMTKRSDGYYDVGFNIYRDPSIVAGGSISDNSVYYLTDKQAAAKFEHCAEGKAVLKDKVYKGSDSYEVVSYSVDYK